jgi:hypothetical protein
MLIADFKLWQTDVGRGEMEQLCRRVASDERARKKSCKTREASELAEMLLLSDLVRVTWPISSRHGWEAGAVVETCVTITCGPWQP